MIAPVLFEDNAISRRGVADAGHEGTHQQHAAAAGAIDMVAIGGIRQRFRVEARSLVGDFHAKVARRYLGGDTDVLSLIAAIAVNDGVNQRFVHCEVDAKYVLEVPMPHFQFVQQFLQHVIPLTCVTGNYVFTFPGPGRIGRGHRLLKVYNTGINVAYD
jgi:hypothetical protein